MCVLIMENENTQPKETPAFESKLLEIRAENDRLEKNIKELKELKAIDALGGKTSSENKQKPKEDNPTEYAQKALRGEFNPKPNRE